MASITVNGNTVVPEEIPDHVPQAARKTNFILVQGDDRDFNVKEKLELAALGVEIQEYVAEHTYLCRYEPEDLEPIRSKRYVKNVTMSVSNWRARLIGILADCYQLSARAQGHPFTE